MQNYLHEHVKSLVAEDVLHEVEVAAGHTITQTIDVIQTVQYPAYRFCHKHIRKL